jgi:hypothetical protein
MSRKQMQLVNLLCEQIGIKTLGELEAFKQKTQANTNDALLKKLALCVAFDRTLEEVLNNEHL